MINLAIIDDHKMLLEVLTNSIRNASDNYFVNPYSSGKIFVEEIYKQQGRGMPDIIISDLLMPELSKHELVFEYVKLIEKYPENRTKIIVLSSIHEIHTIKSMMKIGVSAYLSKAAPLDDLLEAISTVNEGETFFSREIKEEFFNFELAEHKVEHLLSPREHLILTHLCKAETVKEIAFNLSLSVHTVRSYQKSIMKKLKVNRTPDLILFALDHGIVSRNEY